MNLLSHPRTISIQLENGCSGDGGSLQRDGSGWKWGESWKPSGKKASATLAGEVFGYRFPFVGSVASRQGCKCVGVQGRSVLGVWGVVASLFALLRPWWENARKEGAQCH